MTEVNVKESLFKGLIVEGMRTLIGHYACGKDYMQAQYELVVKYYAD